MGHDAAPEPLRDPATLRRLLSPGSVAVVGVSAEPTAFGARTVDNLAGFDGPVWAINPRHAGGTLHGRPCVAGLRDLPQAPDCVVLALPRTGIAAAVAEAAAIGAGGVIAYASGYGETGLPDRVAEEAALRAQCRDAGLPLLGVNCLGAIDQPRRAGLTFMPDYARLAGPAGGVAVTSQSGALGYALMQAAERGLAPCHLATVGNGTDLDACDLVAYQLALPECRAVALALEGLRDARRLLLVGDAARRADKPVVVQKLGRGTTGAAAAISHTGSLAGSAEAWSAAFARAGLLEVFDFDALLETAAFLAKVGRPRARGVAIVTPSGGAGIMAADHAEAIGLALPQPQPRTEAVLRAAIPEFGSPRNPCDLTAQVATQPAMYQACMEAMLADPGYAAVVVPVVFSHQTATALRMDSLRPLVASSGKPVIVAWLPEQLEGPGARVAEAAPELPLFRSTRRMMEAIRLWFRHADALADDAPAPGAAAHAAAALLPAGDLLLGERAAGRIFARAGLPVIEERRAADADAAVAAAEALGFPVALKLDSADVAHKTEVGGVRLHLADADAVRAAFAAILDGARRHAPHARVDGVLVQPMARPGVELILGARRDPQFGPMVLVGLGGVQAELWRDVALDLAPVSADRARAMLRGLRGFALLDGFRGAAPADLDAVAAAVAAFSALVAAAGDRIEEAEINPLIAGDWGCLAVDGLLRLRA